MRLFFISIFGIKGTSLTSTVRNMRQMEALRLKRKRMFLQKRWIWRRVVLLEFETGKAVFEFFFKALANFFHFLVHFSKVACDFSSLSAPTILWGL